MLPDFDRTYFEDLYARCPDPWGYESSAYEHAKYAMTMGALPRATYRSVLEFGCSIGVLTQRLSAICGKLVGVDTSSRALAAARRRCPYPHVDFLQAHLPQGQWGTGYDLAVFSEVLYYLDRDAIAVLGARLKDEAAKDAQILLVHWTGETDYPMSGDAAVEALKEVLAPRVLGEQREPNYRLDLWTIER